MRGNAAANNSNPIGIGRIEAKLQASLAAGDFYEAHQMYRTLYFRYITQRKFDELKKLLFDGAVQFLRLHQLASGLDLAVLFVDVLGKSSSPLDDIVLDELELLYSLLPAKDENSNRDKLVQEAVKWSVQIEPNFQFGHPRLHARLAFVLWREKNYATARRHFLLCDDGTACASFLIEYHLSSGLNNEADLFLAQAVLQYLCRKNVIAAEALFSNYVQNHPQFCPQKEAPYVFPLLNFLKFLLVCVEAKNITQYSILIEKYQPVLSRDPCFRQYLDKIGQIYFGMPAPNRGPGESIFGNLLKDLLNTEESESESGDENGTSCEGGSFSGAKPKTEIGPKSGASSKDDAKSARNDETRKKTLCEDELD